MGGSKKQTVGYWYELGLHMGFCYGPVDALLEIRVGDRTIWTGEATTNTNLVINQENLFGGKDREGGVVGTVNVMMGGASQTANSYLSSVQSGIQTAYRGLLGLVFNRGKVSANNPYIKPWSAKVRRILSDWDGAVWNSSKAEVNLDIFSPQRQDWRYMVTSNGDNTDRSGITYDDTGWSVGRPPFASEPWFLPGSYGFATVPATVVPSAQKVWMRTHVQMGKIPASLRFQAFVDNDCRVYINGQQVLQVGAENGAYYDEDLPIWPFFPNADNVIAVEGWDRHSGGAPTNWFWFDWRIVSVGNTKAMNPAHIIYQALTDRARGKGLPSSRLDLDSFTAAADTFYNEGMGLCIAWTNPAAIEDFIQQVCDHCGAAVGEDPSTGLIRLKAIRADYDMDDLPVFSRAAGNVVEIERFDRVAPNGTSNEITVRYVDMATGKNASVTVQHLASIKANKAVSATTKQYPGLPTAKLATRVALRDLQAGTAGLARVTLRCTRDAHGLLPGDVIAWSEPDLYGIELMALRVGNVDYGSLTSGTILLECVEDVFGLPETSYVTPQDELWEQPDGTAQASPHIRALEVPYREIVQYMGAGNANALDASAGYLGMVAARPSGLALNYQLNTKVGAAPYLEAAVADWCPHATISTDLGYTDTVVEVSGTDLDVISVGDAALIDEEIVEVTDIDILDSEITLARGCLDTTPAKHLSGARIWFFDQFLGLDTTEYADSEVVDAKARTDSGSELLALVDSPTASVTMDSRQSRPYPPGQLKINTISYPTSVDIDLEITWAHRDRLLQQDEMVDSSEGSIGPEPGTTYTVKLYLDDDLRSTTTGISGTSHSGAPMIGAGTARVEVWAVRDGVESWQAATAEFDYTGLPAIEGELTGGALDETYSQTLAATTLTSPTWSITAGSLPPGLSIGSSTGTISGEPTTEGYYTFTVRATPAVGAYAERSFTIGIGHIIALLHMDGSAGSTTFIDQTGKTWTANGNAQIATDGAALGGAVGTFDGSGDYLQTADHSDFALGADDWTIEVFMRRTSIAAGTFPAIISQRANVGTQFSFSFESGTSGLTLPVINLSSSGSGIDAQVVSSLEVADGSRVHVAASRKGTKLYLHVNGQPAGSSTISGGYSVFNSTESVKIGAFDNPAWGSSFYNGTYDEMRFTRVAARYDETQTFTPPTTASDYPV